MFVLGYDNKSHYIYIPLHIGVQVNLFKEGGIFCNTGPQFGWLVASKFDDEKVDLSDEDTAYTNWAVRFGVKWNSGEIYALYQTGISKNMKDVEFWGVGLGFCF